MRFGFLSANQHPTTTSAVDRFSETIEHVRLARDLGFDLIVFGQHFLPTEFQVMMT